MTSFQYLLNVSASDHDNLVFSEDAESALEQLEFSEGGELLEHSDGDSTTLTFVEEDAGIIDEISVVFNQSQTSPGYTVTLRGLQEGTTEFHTVEVWRRDVSGYYRDERVRGLAEVTVQDNDMVITDYEAPLNTELEYYLRLFHDGGQFDFGPIHPIPNNYIPVQEEAYGHGLAYLKLLDVPELSTPVIIQEMDEWDRPGREHGSYEVLGRRNPVIITDVMGGREGSIEGMCVLEWGQSYEDIEDVLNPGATILVQNVNRTMSAFPDMYVKIDSASFERFTKMRYHGELSNPKTPKVIVTFSLDYKEVDRPDPTSIVVPEYTWQSLLDTHSSWGHVLNRYEAWKDVLINPFGPADVITVVEEFETTDASYVLPNNAVNPVTIECWGGGACGREVGTRSNGSGGGAYAQAVRDLTPGNTYEIQVATETAPGDISGGQAAAPSSYFKSSTGFTYCEAVGGTQAGDGMPGQGGLDSDSTGDIRYSGGNGGQSNSGATGGGGGGASTSGGGFHGTDADGSTPGTGGAGGAGSPEGGDGGDGGVDDTSDAHDGQFPGGGGGGQPLNQVAGNGAAGWVRITYQVVVEEES